ncbi:MAG TPA: hypothetical protein VIJ07_05050, partial [Dermatophilaceae bacterium]
QPEGAARVDSVEHFPGRVQGAEGRVSTGAGVDSSSSYGQDRGEAGRSPDAASCDATATAEIISVRAGDASTILTWKLSSATDTPVQGFTLSIAGRSWPDAAALSTLWARRPTASTR